MCHFYISRELRQHLDRCVTSEENIATHESRLTKALEGKIKQMCHYRGLHLGTCDTSDLSIKKNESLWRTPLRHMRTERRNY